MTPDRALLKSLDARKRQRLLESFSVGHFRLNQAMLCADLQCNAVFAIGPDSCPSCTGRQFFSLASLVDRPGLQVEIEQKRAHRSTSRTGWAAK